MFSTQKNKKIAIIKIAKKIAPFLFYVLLLFFLFFYLRNIDYSQLNGVTINWWYVVAACGLGLLFRYWGALIWIVLLRGLGAKSLGVSSSLQYVYAKSWLGRYIPGAAPWLLGKIYFASKYGISKNKLAISSLLEAALQIAVQIALAFALLIFNPLLDVPDHFKLLMVLALIVCVTAMTPKIFNKITSTGYKLIRKKKLHSEHYANARTIGKGASLYAVGSIINALSFFMIAKAVYPELGIDNLLFVMGAGTLAGAIGMLVVFAPSGIGVREGIQLLLLSSIMPAELALLVTVVTRLFNIGIDFTFYLITLSLHKLSRKENTV